MPKGPKKLMYDWDASDSFSGNGSTTNFVLSNDYDSGSMPRVVVDGLECTVSTHYTLSSPKTIIFTSAPKTGQTIKVTYQLKVGV